jgi:uncharacterized protein YdeI (YjbR/CyaY-like superfamily)
MNDFERVQVESGAELRAWLEANHTRTQSIWLVIFKKHVADKHIPWAEVVEEALCFGWIDSLPRKLDADRMMLMLSPRRPGSPWSRLNKQRVERLIAANLMTPAGLAAIDRARQDGSWTIHDEAEELTIPDDLLQALAENKVALSNFQAFNKSSRRGILWWIKSAKTNATRQSRISETVRFAAFNLRVNYPEAKAYEQTQVKPGK